MMDTIIGVDLAKRVFQLHGAALDGQVKFKKKLSREQFGNSWLVSQPASLFSSPAVAPAIGRGRWQVLAMRLS